METAASNSEGIGEEKLAKCTMHIITVVCYNSMYICILKAVCVGGLMRFKAPQVMPSD